MPKKMITVNVSEISPHTFSTSLKNLEQEINELIMEHGEDAKFDWVPDFYHPYDQYPSPKFILQKSRLETDEEYLQREEQEEKHRELQRQRDLQEFERLKKALGEK